MSILNQDQTAPNAHCVGVCLADFVNLPNWTNDLSKKASLHFINPCRSRINRAEQQKLALPISSTLLLQRTSANTANLAALFCNNNVYLQFLYIFLCSSLTNAAIHLKQGHHHNGDQAARRPHMMC